MILKVPFQLVHNYAEKDDGTIMDGDNICAKITKEEGKLEVGPCFLPKIKSYTTGPYVLFQFSGFCTTMRRKDSLWFPADNPKSRLMKDVSSRRA